MNYKKVAFRVARRHPRQVFHVALFALRHRKGLARVIRSARQAARVSATVREAAANPKVQAETGLAFSALSHAGRRARKVGAAQAVQDKPLTGQLRRARKHASKAASAAHHPRPRRSRLGRAIAIAAAAIGGVAAYTKWKSRSLTTTSHADR